MILRKTVAILLAFILFVIGIAGLVLPIIPGLLFIALALFILALHFEFIERKLHLLYRYFPALKERIEKWKDRYSKNRD